MDPEELFRTIFGDSFKKGRDFESMFNNYGDNSDYDQQNDIAQVSLTLNNNKSSNYIYIFVII
jgi:hypothetical protein